MRNPEDPILLRSNVFRFLSREHLAAVRAKFQTVHYEFGDVIIQQGDPADAYYILVSGRARVVKTNEKGEELALNSLRPGDEFGEAALLTSSLRTATVRCSTAVEALRLSRPDFLELLGASPALREAIELAARHAALRGFLYEFSNFGRLPATVIRSLIEKLRPADFAKGQTIIREGDGPGPMFIVREGKARAYAGAEGRTRSLAFYREGDFFGELSALRSAPRSASVEALTDCRLLALAPEALRELKAASPEFATLIEERLAQYDKEGEARVPLDFTTETLPADASVLNKVALDEEAAGPEGEAAAGAPPAARRRKRIRRFPFLLQIDEMDCGAASLGMICRHFGRKVPLARIRELCHTSTDGTSLKAICAAATELGLAARGVKASHRNLPEMSLPAIVHWEGNHWIVVYDVTATHVRVADPALGLKRIPRDQFDEKWTGYTILFDYTTDFEHKAQEGRSSLAWLFPFFGRFRGVFLQVVLLAGVVGGLQMLFPIFTQMVVDKVIVDANLGLLKLILLGLGAALFFVLLSNTVQLYLLAFAAVRVDAAVLDFLTRRLLAMPMKYFHARRTGDIQRRLDGAQELRRFVLQNGIGGVLAAAQLVGALAVMAAYSVVLLGVFLLTVPLYVLLMWVSFKVLKPILADLEETQGKYRSFQIDAIKGIEAVKAAGAEGTFRDSMLNQFAGVSRQMFRGTFFFMSYDNAVHAVGMISTALFLWVGATLVIRGGMTLGGFVAFSSLALLADASILRLLGIWEQALTAGVMLNRLNDVLDQEPEQGSDRSRLKPVPSVEGRVELRGVSFRYGGPTTPAVLRNLSLEIAPGKTIAVVGRSGCGKSTLIKLVAGLIEPTDGHILIDGVDLATLNYRDVRRHIGLILQDNYIFSGTILENVAFGDPSPDFDRVLWATQIAAAHEFIQRLPFGYETKIGESGLALSGGQKQRVAIARALYNNPTILIFDEATSALDTESERAIQDNMARLLAGRTAIVVAHRLSTIREADSIVVLEKGEIAEVGNHDELMARRGLYFYLSTQQSGL